MKGFLTEDTKTFSGTFNGDVNGTASGNIPVAYRQNNQYKGKSITIDLTKAKLNTGVVGVIGILVVARSWVATTDAGGMWIVHGIQNRNYFGINQIFRGAYGPSIALADNNDSLTITFYDANGGGYGIYPLF